MHEELVIIPVYAAAWRAKPKDATKGVGRPWSVTVSVGASEGEALRARRSCHERRSEFYDWVRGKIENGEKPVIKVVAHANSKKELNAIEKQTIEELSANGAVLFNKTWNARASNIGKYVDLVD